MAYPPPRGLKARSTATLKTTSRHQRLRFVLAVARADREDPDTSTDHRRQWNSHVALQNNASQIGLLDAPTSRSPGPTDTNDAANQASSWRRRWYYESNGVQTPTRTLRSRHHLQRHDDGLLSQPGRGERRDADDADLLNKHLPGRRYVVQHLPDHFGAGLDGRFLNWICDSNTYFGKGTDQTTGQNFDNDIEHHHRWELRVHPTDRPEHRDVQLPDTGFSAPDGSCGVEATGTLTNNILTIPDTQWPGGTLPSQLTDGSRSSGLTSTSPAAPTRVTRCLPPPAFRTAAERRRLDSPKRMERPPLRASS